MKKTVVFIFALVITSILCGCKTSGKNVLKKRIERMESSSNNPVSIEEIEAAIKDLEKSIKKTKFEKISDSEFDELKSRKAHLEELTAYL